MIKKVVLALGILFALLIFGFAALLFWAQRTGSQQQDKFFQAVMTGDPNSVLVLCDPALREQIDAPVLAVWMGQVRKQLGNYQGLSGTNFSTNANTNDQGSFIDSKGTVKFQQGDATSELGFRNGLLVKFSIDSDKIPKDWFTGPTDTALYRERGEQFVRKFLGRDAKGAFNMMHEELQRQVPEAKLNAMIDEVVPEAGPLKSIAFQDAKFNPDTQKLVATYRVTCKNESFDATASFEFIGLKGHLLGFNFGDPMPAGKSD